MRVPPKLPHSASAIRVGVSLHVGKPCADTASHCMTGSWTARRAVRDAKDGELTDVSPGASQPLSGLRPNPFIRLHAGTFMRIITPATTLHTERQRDLAPGAFHYFIEDGALHYGLRVKLDNPGRDPSAYLTLDGDDPFFVRTIQGSSSTSALHLPTGEMRIRIDSDASVLTDGIGQGNLLLNTEGAWIVGYWSTFSAGATPLFISVRDWTASTYFPTQSFRLRKWSLISRDANGTETALITANASET